MTIKPNCTFSIPSLYDRLGLHGRLYFPPLSRSSTAYVLGFVILAHPYASLGGCMDDAVVQTVTSQMLRDRFVVCTFNFRGASGSPGSTSWTGRPELADYVSFYALLVSLINSEGVTNHTRLHRNNNGDHAPLLILGGYSYGSMIASHLPDQIVVNQYAVSGSEGSAESEIRLRAEQLGRSLANYLNPEAHHGRDSSQAPEIATTHGLSGTKSDLVLGGHEADLVDHYDSKVSNRAGTDKSPTLFSLERVRRRFGSNASETQEDNRSTEARTGQVSFVALLTAHLLISPLLKPVAGFVTMFSSLKFEGKHAPVESQWSSKLPSEPLVRSPTLAVFGAKDVFTTAGKLRKWAENLAEIDESKFVFREIENAGHFWHEQGVERQLCDAVHNWAVGLALEEVHLTSKETVSKTGVNLN